MSEHLPNDINPDLIGKVKGTLLIDLIRAILFNRWDTGFGLRSEKNANGGIISLDPSVLTEPSDRHWRGKVTASSSTSEEHTIEEVDAEDEIVPQADGGRKTTTAKAHNKRKGVPNDTIVEVHVSEYEDADGNPQCFFNIPDGLVDSPKDLSSATGLTADVNLWNVEEDGSPVQVDLARYAFAEPTFGLFSREVICDASGMVTQIGAETKYVIEASESRAALSGWITLTPVAEEGAFIAHNGPGVDTYTLSLELQAGSGIEFDGGATSSVVYSVVVDQLGHVTATANSVQTVEISATGGAADGQGFESVTDGTTTVNVTDGGTIDFDAATPGTDELAVEFTVTNNTPTATVTGVVDISGLTPSDLGGNDVVDVLARFDSNASAGLYLIDDDNYSGRVIRSHVTVGNGLSAAGWQDTSGTDWVGTYIGEAESSDVSLNATSGLIVFVDQSDGYKLKIDYSALPSPGTFVFARILVEKSARKVIATDIDLDVNS